MSSPSTASSACADPGAAFEADLPAAERHALGAHYTSTPDILKIVGPTITQPWQRRIDAARTTHEFEALHAELLNFHVLDPACGCGNFLVVAYRELLSLELQLLTRLGLLTPSIRLAQLHGLDIDPRAVELARATLRRLRKDPRDDSDPDIVATDALFSAWPEVSAIIGNPPFLDARRLAAERPDLDMAALRRAFPGVPGRADLCVYFFRKAHDHLRDGQRAGLVGTNTIRQNYSREGGLDHIINNHGTITNAVASQVWAGDAAVHVSIVNWIKAAHDGPCELTTQHGDASNSPRRTLTVRRISSSLSADTDVSSARPLAINARPFCFEGIQPGHRGFRLTAAERRALFHPDIVSPYMTGDDLLSGNFNDSPEYLIDFADRPLAEAQRYPELLAHLERTVLPDWRTNAAEEFRRTNRPTGEHQNRLQTWWQLKRPRPRLQHALLKMPRYIACSRVTKRPIFAFLDSFIKPDSSLTVFAAADDYTFGVLQSSIHWAWFQARCSTLKRDHRYTSNTVFDSFPWPQSPSPSIVKDIADAAVTLRATREHLMRANAWNLRALHRTLETSPALPLRSAQQALDVAVRAAYGIEEDEDTLTALLVRNHDLAGREADGQPITGPGLPSINKNAAQFITGDRIEISARPCVP